MKLSILLALATSLTAVNAAECSYDEDWDNTRYYIGADGVDDALGKCNGFWDNIKDHCRGGWTCGRQANGDLHAELTMAGCPPSVIHNAWWHATRNAFGHIDCKLRQ